MGTKKEELKDGCFSKVADDEPIFVLRGQDELAPDIVRAWATTFFLYCSKKGLPWEEKFFEALRIASLMEKWPKRKLPD